MVTRKQLQVVSVTLSLCAVCISTAPKAQEADAAFKTKGPTPAAAAS